jgi:flagellar protein FliO/FliZ
MLALSDKIFENKILMFAVATIAFLAAVALLLLIFRRAFGRRLRMPGNGRARPPRLGIVDAFDLDRQRQLVIVRRDNVEHLLMIGGPNDLVIEAEIIRAEARESRPREKDMREKDQKDAFQAPAAVAWPSAFEAPPRVALSQPQPPRKMQPQPVIADVDLEPLSVPVEQRAAAPSPPIPASQSPRAPAFPLPPRRATPPLTAAPQPRPPALRESPGRAEPPSKSDAGANPSGAFQRAPLATPFLRASPQRQSAETIGKPGSPLVSSTPFIPESPPAPADADPSPAPPPETGPQLPAAGPPSLGPGSKAAIAVSPPAPATAAAYDPIDSLEEEMAKLLGRGPGA